MVGVVGVAGGRGGWASEAPVLTEAEILARAADASLPPRWVTVPEAPGPGPLVPRGARVVVQRGPARLGAVACVVGPARDRVVWRRVLAVRGGEALLRADVAPFSDGWFRGVVGCVVAEGLPARIAERAPAAWTAAGWAVTSVRASVRGFVSALRVRPSAPGRFTVRALGPSDAEALHALLARTGRDVVPIVLGHAQTVVLGLFTADGALVGRTVLRVEDPGGWSGGTLVDPAWRGRGGAVALLRGALAAAWALGLPAVRGSIHVHNRPSLAAVARAGFVRTGRWTRFDDPFRASELQWVEVLARRPG